MVDSSNIERNLYLTLQLLEQGIPLIIDLNMQDEAEKRGIKIDVKKLEAYLGYPVLLTIARDGKSLKNMLNVFTSISMEGYGASPQLKAHIARVHEIEAEVQDEKERQARLIELRYEFIDSILQEAVEFSHVGTSTSEKIVRRSALWLLM